jgi:hypothetical protein
VVLESSWLKSWSGLCVAFFMLYELGMGGNENGTESGSFVCRCCDKTMAFA